MKMLILKMLHANHSGITKIKQLARRTVYWFGLNTDIEEFVKSCRICTEMNSVTKPHQYSQWIPTVKPFSRIHADFFHLDRKTFLIIVDSYSKWIEMEYMKYGTDAKKVVKIFLNLFARYGLPDVLMTDGGPPFNSEYFVNFFQKQGILVMKSPPYHPESNGQAERMVRLVKDVFKKFLLDPEIKRLDIEEQISYFLFNYRNTCLGTDGIFPSEILFSYKPKNLLDLINPKKSFKHNLKEPYDDTSHDYQPEEGEPSTSDNGFKNLTKGDLIYYKNNHKTGLPKWIQAKFLKNISKTISQILLGGRIVLAHRRQLKLAPTSRRKPSIHLVYHQDYHQLPHQNDFYNNSKRKREEDAEDPQTVSDSSSDFYGFPADSYIYSDVDQPEEAGSIFEASPNEKIENHRKSSRRLKRRRKSDFVYY
ncbi:uncharacterized protein K02A2.6-like [Uranotaenia lowii]|uniref:uncharacterized protein K02A2.6-like n=1 Tax=Uranotaenia lowii TaxID=190385 RepID=UPI0024788419|nr:uncharacterized protein K02A2.6-like [Uranotaenia lowii]XP_055587556.1 uncharacterized protein K02A2.6-like [Uranotaenia lowii]